MKILIEGECLKNYLAKCHESFRNGLKKTCDTRCFGPGYDGYDDSIKSYDQIIKHVFPNDYPDIIILSCERNLPEKFKYDGINDIRCPKIILLADYWSEAAQDIEKYMDMVVRNRISFIMSYFPQPVMMWKTTKIGEKLIYVPPCFDPSIFTDWKMEKKHDVGFLADMMFSENWFYQERFAIHQRLLKEKNFNYFYAPHPGWGMHNCPHPLVGENFSKAINSCKIFITTGGIFRNLHAKYIEITASKSLLLADEPTLAESQGFVDGLTYIKISPRNVVEKINYYLQHENERQKICENGYRMVCEKHNNEIRARSFCSKIEKLIR